MPNIYITHRKMFNEEGVMLGFGGIEKYIVDLAACLSNVGYQVVIVQPDKCDYRISLQNYSVLGVKNRLLRGNLKKYALFNKVKKISNPEDIVIFASDSYSVPSTNIRTISIQHGVSWDKPRKSKSRFIQFFDSVFRSMKYISSADNSKSLICVDHNFVNWYRTWFDLKQRNIRVIYNYYDTKINATDFHDKWQETNEIKIIIARRFVSYRGVASVVPVIKNLLIEFPNLRVTFAGDGADKGLIDEAFKCDCRVNIIQYLPVDSYKVHKSHHIAIVPTLGSEGTSLAMIEAMAAGCCIITTNVGGLSNVVIDNHNGLIVMPGVEAMQRAIAKVLTDVDLAKKLAANGLATVSDACSKDRWQKDWLSFIDDIKQ